MYDVGLSYEEILELYQQGPQAGSTTTSRSRTGSCGGEYTSSSSGPYVFRKIGDGYCSSVESPSGASAVDPRANDPPYWAGTGFSLSECRVVCLGTSDCIGFDYRALSGSNGYCNIRFPSASILEDNTRPWKFSASVSSGSEVCTDNCIISHARREHVDALHISNRAVSGAWTCCRKDWREPDFLAIVGDHCYSFRHWNEGVYGRFRTSILPTVCENWAGVGNSYLAKLETRTETTAMAEVRARYWGGSTSCARVGAMNIGKWLWYSDMNELKNPPSGLDNEFQGKQAICSCWAPGTSGTNPARLVGAGCDDTWRPHPMQYVCAMATTTTTTTTTSTTGTTTTTTTTTTVRKCIDHDYGGTPFRAEINLDFATQLNAHPDIGTTIALPLPAEYHTCVKITVDWGDRLGRKWAIQKVNKNNLIHTEFSSSWLLFVLLENFDSALYAGTRGILSRFFIVPVVLVVVSPCM